MSKHKLSFLFVTTFLCAFLSASAILLPTETQSVAQSISVSGQSAQVSGVTGTTYYVSPSGNDSNAGTLTSPWKTIGKANNTLQAGDAVLIRAGSYNEDIDPQNSGTAGNPITYKGYQGEQVYVRGDDNTTPIVFLHSKQYITIDGLNIYFETPASGSKENAIELWGGGHHVFKNLHIVRNGNPNTDKKSGIDVNGFYFGLSTADNLLDNIEIRNLQTGLKFQVAFRVIVQNSTIVDNYGDSIRIDSAQNRLQGILIKNNILGGSLVSDGLQTDADYDLAPAAYAADTSNRGIILLGNIIYGGPGENGVDLKGSSDILVDGNVIYGWAGDNDGFVGDNTNDRLGNVAVAHGTNVTANNDIIRNNVIFDSAGGLVVERGWRAYNNTIIGNNRDYTGSNSTFVNKKGDSVSVGVAERGTSDAYSVLKNNIIGDHMGAEISLKINPVMNIDHNLYYNTSGSVVWKQNTYNAQGFDTYDRYTTLSAWQAHLNSTSVSGKDAHSVSAPPRFINVPSHPTGASSQFDFHLASNSPAIDAGGFLTTATSAGSGTTITVSDARYFFDGYGVTSGDTIQIGTQTATITSIDYTTNKLTLNKSLSWSAGQGVSLPYNGSVPDMGAYESSYQTSTGGGTSTPPTTPSVCTTFSSTTSVPTGYAASYNLFSTAKELLLSAVCGTSSADITIGNNQPTTYIWNQGFVTKNGSTWQPITYTGTQTSGNWIIGQAKTTLPLTTTELSTQNYLAAYVCTYTASTWKCGCSDTSCTVPKWNLQGVKR